MSLKGRDNVYSTERRKVKPMNMKLMTTTDLMILVQEAQTELIKRRQANRPEDVEAIGAIEPVLDEIINQLANGITYPQIREELLIPWLQSKRRDGRSYKVIARMLNHAGVPTVSHRAAWSKGLIQYILGVAAKKEQGAGNEPMSGD
ncbi:MAG: hypothetical protein HQK59_02800 [Deltaproteobacteria bacterium]|nr:hypothetical protein [Deltaproteobacteria bacterium]